MQPAGQCGGIISLVESSHVAPLGRLPNSIFV